MSCPPRIAPLSLKESYLLPNKLDGILGTGVKKKVSILQSDMVDVAPIRSAPSQRLKLCPDHDEWKERTQEAWSFHTVGGDITASVTFYCKPFIFYV